MAVNIRNLAGVDLDQIFAARISAPVKPACNIRGPDGVDLVWRYEPYAGVAQASPTNIRGYDAQDLNQWFTTSAEQFNSANYSVNSFRPSGIAESSLTIQSDGSVVRQGTSTTYGSWRTPTQAGIGSGFEVIFTNAVGLSSNSAPVWTSLSSGQAVVLANSVLNTERNGSATYTIRRVGSGSIVSTGNINLNATVGLPP